MGRLAVKFTMEAIERGVEMPLEEGLFLEATLFGVACATEDMREGTKAFLEKRPAQFKGKIRRIEQTQRHRVRREAENKRDDED